MLKFTFVRGARAGTTLEVAQQSPIRLGRHPDNEVPFDANVDRQVSTFHAEIRQEQEGWVLYDLGSSNGTFVREARVTRHVLSNGDEVTCGTDGPVVHVTLPGASAAVAPTIMAQAAVVPQPAPAPVQPAPAPVQPAPALVQPAPAPSPKPARPPKRRKPVRIWLLFIFLAVGMMLAAGAWFLGEIYRGGGLEGLLSGSGSGGSGSGGSQAADPGALGRAWKQDSDWLEGVDVLVSSAPAPTRQQIASRPMERRIGRVTLRGDRDLSPVVLESRVEALPVAEADPDARAALRAAQSSGAYVLGDSVVSIVAPGGSPDGVTTLGSPLLVTLRLTPQQVAAAVQGWAGAIYLSAVGPQFIFGRLDRGAGTVTFSTRHLSSYAPAATNPDKKETWSGWARRVGRTTADNVKATGGWKPQCEEPLVWSRKPDLKPNAKELKPNGCSAPGKRVQNAYNWWYGKDKHKQFHEKDNPSGLCSFKRACDGHDRCWVKCGKPKHECDEAFQRDLSRAANVCLYRLKRQGSAELEEQRKAITYWVQKFAAAPVGRAGNVLYKWAQEGACTCVFGVAGSWDLDKEALQASAPVVARNMARARGGTAEKWEPRIRQMLAKLELRMVFEESGRFTFSGRDPRGRSQRTRGQWRQQGNYIKLSRLRGSSLPSRTLKIVDGRLMLVRGASGMAGQLWVFSRRGAGRR